MALPLRSACLVSSPAPLKHIVSPLACQVSSYADPLHPLAGGLVRVAWTSGGLAYVLPLRVNTPEMPSSPRKVTVLPLPRYRRTSTPSRCRQPYSSAPVTAVPVSRLL